MLSAGNPALATLGVSRFQEIALLMKVETRKRDEVKLGANVSH